MASETSRKTKNKGETSMTALLVTSIGALFLQSTLFTEYVWPTFKAACKQLLHVLDVH
jgi:hypothetical protein